MRKLAHWLEEYSAGDSTDILRDLALTHTPQGGILGKHIERLIRGNRYREICELSFDYEEFSRLGYTPAEVYHCRQAVAYFSKLEFLEIGIDKEKAALEKFEASEAACKLTNEAFKAWGSGSFQFGSRVESQLYAAQRKIARVLGPVPSYEKLGYRFGKGATSLTKKRVASLREKFAAGVACSEELVPSAAAVLGELPSLCEAWASVMTRTDDEDWYSVPVTISDGVLSFVPKNALTHRATVTEPPLNGLFQLAVGDYLFTKLARVGLNLRDQTRNQSLALEGSRDGKLATIDLSSASDMIATEVVYHLLPLDWADFLARGRSGHITYRGDRYTLQKFSSMGNGYTFPLESLIFWALACSVCEADETVSVYGDDIIVPSSRFVEVTNLLRACGFVVNAKKSYHTGPFRESCGKDYYRGIDVRPYYQSKLVSGLTLFTAHNYYVRRGDQARADAVKRYIHETNLIYGPDGYGDGHLVDPEWTPRTRKDSFDRKGWAGYTFDTFTLKARKDIRPELPSDFVLPTYTIYQRGPSMDPLETVPMDSQKLLMAPFLARYKHRAIGVLSDTLPLPDIMSDTGEFLGKATSLPIDSEPTYKRVSIYKFG